MIFVPYSDFNACATCFDTRTLKRQCLDILRLLRHYKRNKIYYSNRLGPSQWNSVVLMWQNHKQVLVRYGTILAQELLNRGENSSMLLSIASHRDNSTVDRPKWLGWSALHRSHRSALLLEGNKMVIRKAIHDVLKSRGFVAVSIDEWLRSEYLSSFKQLSAYELSEVRHRLLAYDTSIQQNHYRTIHGFTEQSNVDLAWPYQYVEDTPNDDERPTSSSRRPRRDCARAIPDYACEPDIQDDRYHSD